MTDRATSDAPQLSLRDRQRAAIRDELRRAGYQLFVERGFDAVSVDDITEAAGMSRRTFFRHVASKEDLLLGPARHGGAAIARLLEEQPPKERPDRALMNAIVARASAFEGGEQDWRAALLSAPELIDKVTMVSAADREHIIKLTAARMRTDPDPAVDARPGLLVQLAFAAGDFGFQQWIRHADVGAKPLRVWLEESLQSVLHRRWSEGAQQ
jgi:AcrR family transcriptional regulator